MDGTDAYGGYGDYDPGMSDTVIPQGYESPGPKETVVEKDIPPQPTAYMHDSRRQYELDIAGSSFSLPERYTSRYTSYGEVPLIPVFRDDRRTAIHPLVILSTPEGIEEERWKRLDSDGIFSESYDPYSVDIYEIETDVVENTVSPEAKASSGGGASVETIQEKEAVGAEHDSTEMPFLDHLEEFRWALLRSIFAIASGMIISWFITDYFFATFTGLAKKADIPLVTTKLLETLFMKVQMSLIMGIILTLPFVFYFVWSFVSPGLYKREKKWILPLVFASTGCFAIGVSIAYFLIIPMVLMFLKNFIPEDIMPFMTIGDFIGTIIKFILIFGVTFQMPLISYVLAKIGLIKHTWMSKYRKYAIVVIFVVGAVLTPPDPLSQIIMALPLLLLYEVSILVARIAGRKTLI